MTSRPCFLDSRCWLVRTKEAAFMVKKKEGMEDASLTMRDFPECVCTICGKGGSNATRNIAA